ncbi:MAG TPA: ABC transporter substrate-binding protein, partial [Vicinamibacteria bacterium]
EVGEPDAEEEVEVKELALALLLVIPRDSGGPGPEGSAGPAARQRPSFTPPPGEPLDFRGPGREEPEPDVSEVVLGWFGPGDPAHPEHGDSWRGAVVALEQENAAGGYRGKPFRLAPAWSESPWKAGVAEVARLAHEGGAWAVLGGVDGTATHLALQVALKSRFLLLSPGSTDATTDAANVPWLFSLPPSDDAIARRLAEALVLPAREEGLAIVAATDHDSHATLVALRRALGDRRLLPLALVEVAAVDAHPGAAVAQALQAGPRRLVVVAPPALAARLVAAARAQGFRGAVLGGPGLSRASFARAAGPSSEGVLAPLLVRASADVAFADAYRARWSERPDAAACLGADAVRLAAGAIRRAGLNRARVRDAVRALAPWTGASGAGRWDARGRNEVLVELGQWRGGGLVPLE